MNLKAIRGPLVLILGLFLMTVLAPATATAFTDLNISGSITFDDGNTFADDTVTGSGSMDVFQEECHLQPLLMAAAAFYR